MSHTKAMEKAVEAEHWAAEEVDVARKKIWGFVHSYWDQYFPQEKEQWMHPEIKKGLEKKESDIREHAAATEMRDIQAK